MDTTQLVVDQEVFVVSGCYYSDGKVGKVVKVSPEGVEVQLARNPLSGASKVIWQFDRSPFRSNCAPPNSLSGLVRASTLQVTLNVWSLARRTG
jgi:hypothetical protein